MPGGKQPHIRPKPFPRSAREMEAVQALLDAWMRLMKSPLAWLPGFQWLPLESVREYAAKGRAARAAVEAAVARRKAAARGQGQAEEGEYGDGLDLLGKLSATDSSGRPVTAAKLVQNLFCKTCSLLAQNLFFTARTLNAAGSEYDHPIEPRGSLRAA